MAFDSNYDDTYGGDASQVRDTPHLYKHIKSNKFIQKNNNTPTLMNYFDTPLSFFMFRT